MTSNTFGLTNGSIPGIPSPPPKVQGDVYLFSKYRITTFELYSNQRLLEGIPSKYDCEKGEFDLLTKDGLRALSDSYVRSAIWIDSISKQPQILINGKEFVNEGNIPYSGIFQLLANGKIKLLKKMEIEIQRPNFHVALNVGNPDYKVIRKEVIFYSNGNQALLWPGKKQGLKIFSDKSSEVNQFIKVNELDLSKEGHLRALVDYYNSLTN